MTNRLTLIKDIIAQGIYKSLAEVSREVMHKSDAYVANLGDAVSTDAMLMLARHLRDVKQRPDLSAKIVAMLIN